MKQEDFFPWDDIPEGGRFPTGNYQFAVEDVTDGVAKSSGNRMFTANFTCVAPAEFVGRRHTEYYVVGTDEAPNAICKTAIGAGSMKSMFKAANVPVNQDVKIMAAGAKGAQLVMFIRCFKETNKESAYYGEDQNKVSRYKKVGEVELGPMQPAASGVPVAQTVAGPPPTMTAPPTQAPAQPAQPMLQPMAAPQPAQAAQPAPAPTPAQPAGPQPVAQPAQPQPAPAPAAQPTQSAPVANAAPADPGGVMLTCTFCNAQVPQAEFGAHVQSHANQNQTG